MWGNLGKDSGRDEFESAQVERGRPHELPMRKPLRMQQIAPAPVERIPRDKFLPAASDVGAEHLPAFLTQREDIDRQSAPLKHTSEVLGPPIESAIPFESDYGYSAAADAILDDVSGPMAVGVPSGIETGQQVAQAARVRRGPSPKSKGRRGRGQARRQVVSGFVGDTATHARGRQFAEQLKAFLVGIFGG